MKSLLIALFCAGALLLAANAHAFAIYNHVDHKVCVQDRWDQMWGSCKFMVPANGHYNGAHGSGIKHIIVVWDYDSKGDCRCTQKGFDIPDGGWANINQDEVTINKHDGSRYESRSVTTCDCGPGSGGPAGQR